MQFKTLLFLPLSLFACQQQESLNKSKPLKIVYVQPFTGITNQDALYVVSELVKVYPHIQLKKTIALPGSAFYKPRNRYRADSLIRFLRDQTPQDCVSIGLTNKDISTSKNKYADWGVMGLAFCPGQACVASAFRVSKTEKNMQLFKVAVHELGHTEGLPHCAVKTCLMRDAEGGNPTNEETGFCKSCKPYLVNRGWKL